MSLTPDQIAHMEAHASDDRSSGIIVSGVVCSVAAIIAVGLRFLARRTARANIGLDDCFIVLGLIITILYVIAYCMTIKYGMGRHVIFVTNLHGFAATAIAAESLYNVAIPIIKISILLLYGRIFSQRNFRYALWTVGAFVVAYSAGQFFADIFQCTPISYLWNPQPGGHCIKYGTMVLASGIINILTDVTMLCMPLPVLWGLQVDKSRRIQLCGIFLMGGFVCIVSIVRLFYAKQVGSIDPSWTDVQGADISTVECCVGIISACLPTYRPLLNRVKHGHVNARSINWPSRHKGSQQQPIALDDNPQAVDSKRPWISIREGATPPNETVSFEGRSSSEPVLHNIISTGSK